MIPFAKDEIDFGCDGHVHTKLCHHAEGEMDEYVEAALACGLKEIIFLEHFETGINYSESTWLSADDFVFYQEECQRLAEKYDGRIRVGAGVEVGLNPQRLNEIRDFISSYPWNRVGLSYHYLESNGEHVNMLSRKQENIKRFDALGHEKVLTQYFNDLLAGLEKLEVDVVCHLDAPLRYCHGVQFVTEHLYLIDDILVEMARRKIALEVNTSGFTVRGEPFPGAGIIDRARRCGLRFVAGSDAHRPQDVGRFFDRLKGVRGGPLPVPY
ncbi:MAG: histidinol-phosphatase [Proteobacteria bacterium]|nr:histidinol-phosphatase [Pseudomonadota bacterium]MBU1640276.1 histidinol-phosphatase [Pseudomonadota bacterium]